jgi:hypothetical protein
MNELKEIRLTVGRIKGDNMKIQLTQKELLALQEALNHIDDHERWMFDVMDGEGLEKAIKKVRKAAHCNEQQTA